MAVVPGACGGSDKSDAEKTVRDFVKATKERDADKFCGELVTDRFLEQTTGATGRSAERRCRVEIRSVKGLDLKLVKIKRTVVEGDRATVKATLAAQGQIQDQLLHLKKEDGRFKLAGSSRR
jgi:hypothetical protein